MWDIETTDRFDEWFYDQSLALKEDVLAAMHILAEFGPQLGRPYVDTVKASAYPNMKELRIQHTGDPFRGLLCFRPESQSYCALCRRQDWVH